MELLLYILLILGAFCRTCRSSRVFELSDRFTEIRRNGGLWLVKFYAPWCGHCKKIEPVWMHVAQALSKTNVKVGKLDVTRFPSTANEFNAYSTPTIKFIKPDGEHTYSGDRTKESIVNYALRMAGAPVQEIKQADTISKLKSQNQLFFVYVGKRHGTLWDIYYMAACTLQPHVFFYSISDDVNKEELPASKTPAVFVHKEGEHFFYQEEPYNETVEGIAYLNATLNKWINEERFETFPRVTNEGIKEIMQTGKYIVLAIVEENKVKNIPAEMLEFRNKLEKLIRKKRNVYHKHFQFGWMGNAELANSILMKRISLPYLLVLNSSTFHHHIPEVDPTDMSIDEIEAFLQKIMNRTSPVYGGNSLHIKGARLFFDFKRSLEDMWRGNPVLLVVVFSLPSLFFLLIMWTCCCADIMDADDGEEADEIYHEKKE